MGKIKYFCIIGITMVACFSIGVFVALGIQSVVKKDPVVEVIINGTETSILVDGTDIAPIIKYYELKAIHDELLSKFTTLEDDYNVISQYDQQI